MGRGVQKTPHLPVIVVSHPALSLKDLMKRMDGKWVSQKRYFYPKTSETELLTSDLSIDFEDKGEENFRVSCSWETFSVGSGDMVSGGESFTEVKGGGSLQKPELLVRLPGYL